MVANQTINIKRGFWRQVEMRNLTYTLSPHSPFAALTDPQKGGKKGAHGLLVTDPLTPKGGKRAGSTEEPDNTNGSKSNHQHKEVSG